jgi:hypothetical protein
MVAVGDGDWVAVGVRVAVEVKVCVAVFVLVNVMVIDEVTVTFGVDSIGSRRFLINRGRNIWSNDAALTDEVEK